MSANPDNFLLTANAQPGTAGLFTIDSHAKRIPGEAQQASREAQAACWREFIDRACEEHSRVGAGESCFGFLRDFLLTVTGGQEGDAKLLERFEASVQPQVKTMGTLGIWPPSLNEDYMEQLKEKLRPGAVLRVLDGDGYDITPLAIRGGRFYGTERELQLKYPVLLVDRLPEAPCGGEGFAGLCKGVASEQDTAGADIGYRMTDAEIAEVRLGVLGLIRDIAFADDADFARWVSTTSHDLEKPDWASCEFWRTNLKRIDFATINWYLDLVRQAAQQHKEALESLPPLPEDTARAEPPAGPPVDEAVDAEAASVCANVALWRALPAEVRHLLRKEIG